MDGPLAFGDPSFCQIHSDSFLFDAYSFCYKAQFHWAGLSVSLITDHTASALGKSMRVHDSLINYIAFLHRLSSSEMGFSDINFAKL